MQASGSQRGKHSRGQSLVELALILPVILTILGGAVDISRVYGAWIALEGATRDAAEQVATFEGPTSNKPAALARAKTVICSELTSIPGFVAPVDNPAACTQPNVVLNEWSWTKDPAKGANDTYPIGTATVTATLPFQTFFSYPFFTQAGAWTITSKQTYSIVQGR